MSIIKNAVASFKSFFIAVVKPVIAPITDSYARLSRPARINISVGFRTLGITIGTLVALRLNRKYSAATCGLADVPTKTLRKLERDVFRGEISEDALTASERRYVDRQVWSNFVIAIIATVVRFIVSR